MNELERQISFGRFRIDFEAECLWRDEEALRLRPKTWDVLRYLVGNSGRLVTKDELITEIWAGTIVSEGTLTQSIRELRAALEDDPKAPTFIATVHRRGYRFIAEVEPKRTAAGLIDPGQSSFLGRDRELADLNEALASAMRGQRRTLFITGDAGIGKTALLEEFLRSAVSRRPGKLVVARGQCVEQRGEAEPYLPVLEALHGLCNGSEGTRVVAVLKRFAPTWLVQMPWLLAAGELEALQRQLMGAGSERMLREFTTALAELAKDVPLVLLLEDLHWSDLATLDLVAALARRRDATSLMVVASARRIGPDAQRQPLEDMVRTLAARGDATEIELDVLGADAARTYVLNRLDQTAPPALVDAICRHSGGSPLFLVTAVAYALEQGWVVKREDSWQLTIDAAELETAIPAGLRQLIEVQMAGLERDERALLQACSVVGMEFAPRILAIAIGKTVEEIEALLLRLSQRHRFIQRAVGHPPAKFELTHALYQQVLYEGTATATRRQLHLEMARALELDHRDRASEIAAELAVHFERGGNYHEAANHLGVAALNARARVADRESAILLEHALRLIAQVSDSPRRKRREADLWIQLGAVRGSIYGRGAEQYFAAFQRAWELSQELDDVPRMFLARIAAFGYFGLTEQLRRAEEVCHDLLALAARVPMPDMVAVAHAAMGSVLLGMGRLEEARDHLENALATLNPYDPSTQLFRRLEDPEILCLTGLAWVLAQLGFPDQARHRCATAIEIGRSRAPYHHVYCLNAAAILDLFLHDPLGCAHHAEATLALAREHGFDGFLGTASLLSAWARETERKEPGGWRRLQEEFDAYRRCSQRFGLVPYQALVAEACLIEGAISEGLSAVAAGEAMIAASGEQASEGNLLRIKAMLLAAAGREDAEVEQCFVAAIAAAQRCGAKLTELRATTALAAWSSQRGHPQPAREQLAMIYNWFTEGFHVPDLRRAKAMLVQLSLAGGGSERVSGH